jgi:hypothetical protein
LKKNRDRILKKARRTDSVSLMLVVKELDKVIKKTVKKECDRLISNKMKNSSSATFWTTVNGLLGCTNSFENFS